MISLISQDGNGLSANEEHYDKCLTVPLCIYVTFSLVKSPRQICRILHTCLIIRPGLSNYSGLTYNDKDHGFSIQYPLGWTIGQGDSEFNAVVRFVSAQNDANVDIRIFPKEGYKSIDEYGDTFKDADNEYKLVKYYRNSSTTLSDKPAFRVIYLTTYNSSIIEKAYGYKSFTSKVMMVATMIPERDSIYALAYFTKPLISIITFQSLKR
jgi:PsbP